MQEEQIDTSTKRQVCAKEAQEVNKQLVKQFEKLMGKEEPSQIEQKQIHVNNNILPQKKSVAFIND